MAWPPRVAPRAGTAGPKAISPKEAVPIDARKTPQNGPDAPQGGTPAPAEGTAGAAPAKRRKKKKKKRRNIFLMLLRGIFTLIGCVICLCVMAASVGAVLLSMYVVQVTAGDEETLDLDSLELAQTSIIYDINGDQYATLTGDNNRIWKDISEMPKNLQNAVVAIEDKDFYQETLGINIKRNIAAALNEFTNNRLLGSQQGASTLEQQLIKNLTHDDQKDIMRKVREIFRAMGVARRYSKETVLEAYLNTIPLTGTINGMEVGANEYFGKTVSELTLAECATLASITKNPTRYHPYTNPENLKQRRDYILSLMRNQGMITEAECAAAQAEPVTLVEANSQSETVTRTSRNSWFTDALYEDLMTALQEVRGLTPQEARGEIFSGGLRIESTVDPYIQETIEQLAYNEDDEFFPAYRHQEEVETEIPVDAEITYDEDGLPLNPDGSSIFAEEDVPVYTDNAETELRTGKSKDGETVVFYEWVRTQMAAAVLDYDGNILAIVGGLGEKKYDRGTNRATIPHQTGSTMKPIGAYCRAIDNRILHYSSPITDSPLYTKEEHKVLDTDRCRRLGLPLDPYAAVNQARDDVWRDWPQNYGGAGGNGSIMLLYDGLRRSYNTIAVQVGNMLGAEDLFTFTHDTLNCTYLSAEHDMDLAPIVLGAQYQGLTVVQLAGAYSIFYDGSFTTPHYFTRVYDSNDNLILDNTRRVTTTQAIRPDTATIMNRLLYNVINTSAGTASGMAPDLENGLEAVGKTGTTSDDKDYTFAALTPYYVTAVWWGYDKPADMRANGATNGRPTQRFWKTLMEEIEKDLEYKEFPMAENVVQRHFDTSTGRIISSGGAIGYYTEDNMEDTYAGGGTAGAGGNPYDINSSDPNERYLAALWIQSHGG